MKRTQQACFTARQMASGMSDRIRRAPTGLYQAASPGDVLAHMHKLGMTQAILITDRQILEAGLCQGVLDVLNAEEMGWEIVTAQDAEQNPRPMEYGQCFVVVGDRGMTSVLPAGREAPRILLPMIATANGLSCLHLLAHTLEAGLNRCLPRRQRKQALNHAAAVIRWMRAAALSSDEELSAHDMAAAAAMLAALPQARTEGPVHALAQAALPAGLRSYEALYGAGHNQATAAVLPVVLKHYAAHCPQHLAALAQAADLASGSAGEDVAVAALMTWLRDTLAFFGVPDTLEGLKRRDIPARAARAGAAALNGPVPMDRFDLEDMLIRLAPEEARITDAAALTALQRSYFEEGATLPVSSRLDALHRLRTAIGRHEQDILDALRADLGKGADEAYLCEIGMVLSELTHMERRLKRYAADRRVPTPLHQFPSRSFTLRRPYGVTLIMSPWNYPFLLTMGPLIGAIAAGNCCVVKPSAYAPETSRMLLTLVTGCFPQEHVSVVTGGREENRALLDQRFDKIFFTGGETVGREVLRKAAEHLTPVTLELGGKSPVIVDKTAKIDLAAKRIAFGKLLNAGQTCVAPDYVLVDEHVQEEFIARLKHWLTQMAGENPLANEDYVHMVNRRQYDRVTGLIDPAKVVHGGLGDPESLRIQPTVMTDVTPDDPVMMEEIFGPVLPVITIRSVEEAVAFISSRPTPLALYLFTGDSNVRETVLRRVPFGGGCINDTIIHLASTALPFGGLGRSGMGRYHGRYSFDCFSHEAGVVDKATWLDLPMRYAPYHRRLTALTRFFLK